MKPHFTIVGTITNPLHITTSKNGVQYLQLDVDSVWTGKDQNNNFVDEKGTYRILFYGDKANMVFSYFVQGDMVEVDCSLSSTVSQAKNDSGIGNQNFVNYSVTGFRIEHVRRFQEAGRPQQQQPQQRPQPQQWGNTQNYEEIPF